MDKEDNNTHVLHPREVIQNLTKLQDNSSKTKFFFIVILYLPISASNLLPEFILSQ
jgi:hypothetical protein